jgi:hypothetical protein
MLNQGLVAYPYLETTTATAINALTDNEPRYDWLSGSAALLLEPSRTNLIVQSEYLGSNWVFINTNYESNASTSPESLINATKVYANTSSSNHYFERTGYTGFTSGNYTYSFFAKSAGSDFVQIATSTGFDSRYQNFNLTTGTKASGDADLSGYDTSITPVGDDGWYRVTITANAPSTSVRFLIIPILTDAGRNPTFAGDGTSGVYIYGAQMEQNATYPTSYIPTYGTIEERVADSAITSVTNTTSRTYYIEGSRLSDENYASSNGFYDPDDNLAITFWSSNRLRFRFGGAINDYYTLVGDDFKIAISYDGTDCVIYINGQEWKTRTFTLGNVSSIRLQSSSGAVSFNKTLHFPTALSYDDCITLTTP